jgi:2-methylcitrate dehydratase PrpD
MQHAMEPSLTNRLILQLKSKEITDADRNRAAVHVLDWLGCCSLAKHSLVAKNYQAYIEDENSNNDTFTNSIFGDKCYWQDALLINGALGNVLEMDDIHRSSILHPGPVVIPAALVIAQKYHLPMRNFLNAVVLGYEITIRLGESIGRSHYKYFHNTATCAGFGAALAVSHLLELSVQKVVHALGNVGSKTSGLWQMRNESVQTKQWHNSEAARSGVMATILASKGVTGPEYILEGPQGVFNALSTDATPANFLKESPSWRIFDCSFKPWPACRHAHPAIDVVLEALSQSSIKVAPEDIKEVTIYTYQDALIFCDKPHPKTELQAKFSIQHAVASVLVFGEPKLEHYYQENLNELDDFRQLIVVKSNQEFEDRYPYHYGAQCEIILHNGQCLNSYNIDTLGDPERPLSIEQIKAKANMLMTAANIPVDKIQKLISMKWSQAKDLAELSQLITIENQSKG